MKCIAYLRVSTADQKNHGVSVDAQRQFILDWAALHGHEIVSVHCDDGISGSSIAKRPMVQKAIAEAIETKTALVVYSLSRLSRNHIEIAGILSKLDKAGVALVSITEQFDRSTAAGWLFFQVMAMMAEFELKIGAERTVAAMEKKRVRCEALGNTPYGFTKTHKRKDNRAAPPPKLVVDDAEFENVITMLELRSNGYGTRRIAHALNEAGRLGRTGNTWSHSAIARVIRGVRRGEYDRLLDAVGEEYRERFDFARRTLDVPTNDVSVTV